MPGPRQNRSVEKVCTVCGTIYRGARYNRAAIYCSEACIALSKKPASEWAAGYEFYLSMLGRFLTLREPLWFEETKRRLEKPVEYFRKKLEDKKAA